GLLEFTRLTGDLILSIRQCRRPVVAALNGTVAGAGAVIAAASDIRIAAEGAKIAFLFSRVGLTGADIGAAWVLPRIVGMAHASEILMVGDFISAQRAAEIGLYNRVVPGDQLMQVATEVACRLARGPSVALGITKQALNEEAAMDLVRAIEWEARAQADCMQLPNFREAYEAFRAKREPRFEQPMPDCRPIRPFLRPTHAALAARASRFVAEAIAPRPEPVDDAAGRSEARTLLGLLGGWQQPILDLDLRGCCLMREALAQASPLADAVFALQGLGTTAILLG